MRTIGVCVHLGKGVQRETPIHVCTRKSNVAMFWAEPQLRIGVNGAAHDRDRFSDQAEWGNV